tara:strand:+ start:1525 stop:2235 length:711 start_codon:yes stop_codon:yes gene_type:complete
MKKLPIDIISASCINPVDSLKTLDYCSSFFEFNNSILFTDSEIKSTNHQIVNIDKFQSIDDYSNFILKLGKYIESSHVLIVQDDGHIVNKDIWSDDFLDYDYIGAPWPSSKKFIKRWSDKKYGDTIQNIKLNRVGNGGFSLRSKNFLNYSSQFEDTGGIAEDIFLCLINYQKALSEEIKFAPFDIAIKFSYEVPLKGFNKSNEAKNKTYNLNNHFGWHGKRFLNSDKLMKLKFNKS